MNDDSAITQTPSDADARLARRGPAHGATPRPCRCTTLHGVCISPSQLVETGKGWCGQCHTDPSSAKTKSCERACMRAPHVDLTRCNCEEAPIWDRCMPHARRRWVRRRDPEGRCLVIECISVTTSGSSLPWVSGRLKARSSHDMSTNRRRTLWPTFPPQAGRGSLVRWKCLLSAWDTT